MTVFKKESLRMTVLRSLPPLGPKCASRLHGTSFRLRVSDLYRGVYAASGRQPNADEVWTWSCESRGRYDYLSYCDDRGTYRCARVTHGARGAQMIGGFGALIRAQERSLSLLGTTPFHFDFANKPQELGALRSYRRAPGYRRSTCEGGRT